MTTWTTIALTPLLVFLACVLQPDVDISKSVRREWFYSADVGPHRILAKWHTIWLALACVVSGVAQFLAWREAVAEWYYPAAMCVFFVGVAIQWAWAAAHFRIVDRFRASRLLLVVLLCVHGFLAVLYSRLHILAMVLAVVRTLLHDVPMLFIANVAVGIHAPRPKTRAYSPAPTEDRAPATPEMRDIPPPVPAPPAAALPRRHSASRVIDMLGIHIVGAPEPGKDTTL